MPPLQVLGLRQQSIAPAQARRQRLRPGTAVEAIQKVIKDKRELAFVSELERRWEPQAHTKRGRFARKLWEMLLPLREQRRPHGLQSDASRWDEVQHRFVTRLLVLAYEHMAAAAADRQPVEIAGPFRLSLPPLGRLTHADTAESIAYRAVAGVLQHAVTD
jgi:hypothetical protein